MVCVLLLVQFWLLLTMRETGRGTIEKKGKKLRQRNENYTSF